MEEEITIWRCEHGYREAHGPYFEGEMRKEWRFLHDERELEDGECESTEKVRISVDLLEEMADLDWS